MPIWQAALLLNLTFAVALGLGYATWGHRLSALDRDITGMQAQVERLERERAACAAGARTGEQRWRDAGSCAVYPQLILISHEGHRRTDAGQNDRLSPGGLGEARPCTCGRRRCVLAPRQRNRRPFLVEMTPW